MSNQSASVVDYIGAALLLYVFYLLVRNLWPFIVGTQFGQELVEGTIRGLLLVGLAVLVYVLVNRDSF